MQQPIVVPVEHALCVYAEPAVAGRRVVVVGDASLGLGGRLAEMGARLVHVYDPDAARAQATATPKGVSIGALPAGDFDVRDGAFDVAIVSDLGGLPDAPALVARLRRLLGDAGVLVARSCAGAGPDYYELYDLISLQFANVRMVGELPFFGVTLAELGEVDEAPQVSVETQLAGEQGAPQAFIVVASQRGARLDPYVLVQLPARPRAEAAVAAPVGPARSAEFDARIAAAEERAATAAERAATAEGRIAAAEGRAGDKHVRAEQLTHEIKRLEDELERQRERSVRLTRDVEDERRAKQKAEVELGMVRRSPELASTRERIAALEESLRGAEKVNREWQARNAALEQTAQTLDRERAALVASGIQEHAAQLADLKVELDARAEVIAQLEGELARAVEAHPQEIAQYEAVLRDRAQAIQALELEILRRERLVQELVAALEEAREQGGPGDAVFAAAATANALAHETDELRRDLSARSQQLARASEELARHMDAASAAAVARDEGVQAEAAALRAKLDARAMEDARREGELQARGWRIAELERRLAAAPGMTPPSPPASADTTALADELDALRKALAQEHAARALAESGEAFARARAEIERQSVLIAQLSAELDARDRDRSHATT